jgi:2-methylcitrate dehydratase PrpD
MQMAPAHGSRRRAEASAARALAAWATEFDPSPEDMAMADRSLRDTIAVATAAKEHPLKPLFEQLNEAGRGAATAHVLDFDDLHMTSTAHISAICVPAALATNPCGRPYLAGAGVMARLGTALGWPHYSAGWHATCTAGAPAAAVTAAIAQNLDAEQIATAIALAIPAAGGVQRAFGTASKSLQVGFAADAGVRSAALAANGATADLRAVDDWMRLVNGDPDKLDTTDRPAVPGADRPAVPGGLAIKMFPCCYALQRPISALKALAERPPAETINRIRVYTPASSLHPLIHARPTTGLEAKFSLEYALAAFLIDGRADFETFSDEAVRRRNVRELMERIEIRVTSGGEGLLTGELTIEIATQSETFETTLALPPGAPERPPTHEELREKLEMCGVSDLAGLTWDSSDLAERVDPS